MSHIELLNAYGDRYEKESIILLDLENNFPRYAEFWSEFVKPNRRNGDASKLQDGILKSLEIIFNTHYSILWHLLRAKKQNNLLRQKVDGIDFAEPLSHLASCVDLIQKLFILVAKERKELVFQELSEQELDNQISKEKKSYSKQFKSFQKTLRPVQLSIHTPNDLFKKIIENNEHHKEFDRTSLPIRQYRNIMLHSLSPIRWVDNTTSDLFPRPDKLSKYSEGNWSSGNVDKADFDHSHNIVDDLLYQLINSINLLWVDLIQQVAELVESETVWICETESDTEYPINQNHEFQYTDGQKPEALTGFGTAEIRSDNPPYPSGYTSNPINSPF